jgi:hypothetical protein
MTTRFVPWITALTLLVAAGTVHGLWSDRWRPSDALEAAAARLEQVPIDIGDWQGKDVESDAAAFAQAGARAYWTRAYTHRYSGGTVLAILMCGRSGRMAVHTPEICYRGAGYDLVGTPAPVVVRDEDEAEAGTLWSARFAKQAGTLSDLRLYWGWNGGGDWRAPANPRWEFRGRPYLYKLYVSQEITDPSEANATADFVRQLLPVLKEVLAEPEG